jgi:hypothetical protein
VLPPIDQDEESQDVAALLNRSQSNSHANAGAAAAGGGATKEADALAALAKSSSGAFRFTMFGRDLTNSQDQQQQVSWILAACRGVKSTKITWHLISVWRLPKHCTALPWARVYAWFGWIKVDQVHVKFCGCVDHGQTRRLRKHAAVACVQPWTLQCVSAPGKCIVCVLLIDHVMPFLFCIVYAHYY